MIPVGAPVAARPTVWDAPWVTVVVTVVEERTGHVGGRATGRLMEKSLGWAVDRQGEALGGRRTRPRWR